MPNDAKALMELAPQVNGLNTPGMKPWHVKLSYRAFDNKGKTKDQGTFEEWWAAPDQDKRAYESSTFKATEFVTKTGTYRSGSSSIPPLADYFVRGRLINPLPDLKNIAAAELRERNNLPSERGMRCVELAIPGQVQPSTPAGMFPTYCFDADKPILRFSRSNDLLDTAYQQIGLLDGHYLGTEFTIYYGGKPFLTAHLIQANLLGRIEETEFRPPENTVKIISGELVNAESQSLTGADSTSAAVRNAEPDQHAPISGTVLVKVLIGEDGSVQEMKLESASDPSFAILSLQQIRDHRFTPLVWMGHPHAYSTEIKVVFHLEKR
jgi:hypothetical protein